jgi:MoxR-like ATPase
MSERQASVDGKSYPLPDPFLVIATQNPFEFEGTYVLPESQLDRFIMRIDVGYPARDAERNILRSHQQGEPVDGLDFSCFSIRRQGPTATGSAGNVRRRDGRLFAGYR